MINLLINELSSDLSCKVWVKLTTINYNPFDCREIGFNKIQNTLH